MEGKIENIALFSINDFECDLKVIADIMRIDGYEGWNKGDQKPYRRSALCEGGLWAVKSPLERCRDAEEHVTWLVELLFPKLSRLRTIYQRYNASSELSISMVSHNEKHLGLHLNQEIIEKVGLIGASIDVDIYSL
ncbi:MAG: DUF4279 domain-containing protein [Bacteroidota bacterium]